MRIQIPTDRTNGTGTRATQMLTCRNMFGVLNHCATAAAILFNRLFNMTTQPSSFSLNFLKSIFKKEDPSDPNNYRGIAMGSAFAEVFNLIILSDKLLSPNQIGFKNGRSTSDHIFVLNSVVNRIVRNEKCELFVAFIDLIKSV